MIDGLSIRHTAASLSATQRDASACLGGYPASTTATWLGFYVTSETLHNVRVVHVHANNATGTGSIAAATTGSLVYTPPGAAAGSAVAIANGETKTLYGAAGQAVTVTRLSSRDLSGQLEFSAAPAWNNCVGMGDVTDAARVAGTSTYRAVALVATTAVTDLKAWVTSGYRVAFDTTNQTVVNDTTEPSGLTWCTGTTEGTATAHGSLASGAAVNLWINRVISAGGSASSRTTGSIVVKFTAGGVTHQVTLSGDYRVADDSLARYELYVGDGTAISYAAPSATSATLPFTFAVTPPISGTKKILAVCRRSNKYGLTSQNIYETAITINSSGAVVTSPPSAPQNVSVTDITCGHVRVSADYHTDADAVPADRFAIYLGNGADPDPALVTPVYATGTSGTILRAIRLDEVLGPYAAGADLRVLVRASRVAGGESENTTATAHTVGSACVAGVSRRDAFHGVAGGVAAYSATLDATGTYAIDGTTRIEYGIGYTELYISGALAWRIRYDSGGAANHGWWTTYGVKQDATVTGAAAALAELVSGNVYLSVNGTRLVKFAPSTGQMHVAAVRQNASAVASTGHAGPLVNLTWNTAIQVVDAATLSWVTAASIDTSGILALGVPMRQRQNTGDFQ